MSTVLGQTEFTFERSTLKVSFVWKFNGRKFSEYIAFNKLCSPGMSSSEKIRFQSGFLAFTDHYIKCYINDADHMMYIKVFIGEPGIPQEFTNCDLSPPRVYRRLENFSEIVSAGILDDTLKTELISQNHFTEEDFQGPKCSKLYWFVIKSKWLFNGYYKHLSTYTGEAITLDFEFNYSFWNKNKKGMQLSNLEDGEGNLAFPTKNSDSVLSTKEFLFSEIFSDFIIECGVKSFHTHRMIIADKSDVFAKMLIQPMKEKKEGRLIIDDFNPEVVEECLRFIYTGHANVAECAMDLYRIGHKYEISDLKGATEMFLMNELNKINLADTYAVGKLYDSKKLMDKCYSFFKLNQSGLLKDSADVEKYTDFILRSASEGRL